MAAIAAASLEILEMLKQDGAPLTRLLRCRSRE